jgi:hypothetical protein
MNFDGRTFQEAHQMTRALRTKQEIEFEGEKDGDGGINGWYYEDYEKGSDSGIGSCTDMKPRMRRSYRSLELIVYSSKKFGSEEQLSYILPTTDVTINARIKI